MSTPTPRTDLDCFILPDMELVVSADFARTLERELAAERGTLAGVIEIKRGVEAELAEMKRRLSSEKLMYKLANDSAIKHEWAAGELRNELATERARMADLVADLNDACITLESAENDCDDYAMQNTAFKLMAVRAVLLQYIPVAAMKEETK